MSEVMTIIILFQSSGFRNFKTYYTGHVCAHLRKEFPGLVSYQRMVELQSQTALPLTAFLQARFGRCTGISFVDAIRARPATDHQAQKEYEEQADADNRQTTAAQT